MRVLLVMLLVTFSIAVLTIMIGQQQSEAQDKIPSGNKLSLPLEVVLYTEGYKVRDITVWAEYQEEVEKYKLNMKGKRTQEVEFDFPPMDRSFLDFYRVCVKNHKSEQINCQWGYWFPGTDSTYLKVKVPR